MGVLSLLSYYIILIHQERFMLLEYIRYSKFIDSFICGKVYFIIVFFVIIVIVISDTDSSISILSGKHRHVFILYLHQQILYLSKDVHVFLFSRLYSVARGKHRMMVKVPQFQKYHPWSQLKKRQIHGSFYTLIMPREMNTNMPE